MAANRITVQVDQSFEHWNQYNVISSSRFSKHFTSETQKHCPHPIVIDTLIAGDSCAVSVVMSAMLFSTVDFNVLQILIESGRFDFQEPLVYHCRNPFQVTEEVDANCSLVVVSPFGMALRIDATRGTWGGVFS